MLQVNVASALVKMVEEILCFISNYAIVSGGHAFVSLVNLMSQKRL